MSVYVDGVRHPFGRMVMCHMWADTLDELLAMADRIGVARKWLQKPPKASWVHFDVSLGMKARAIDAGAITTDRYAALEHRAWLWIASGNEVLIESGRRSLEKVTAARQRDAQHRRESTASAPIAAPEARDK